MMRFLILIFVAAAASGCTVLFTEGHALQPVEKSLISTKKATFDCSDLQDQSSAPASGEAIYKQQIKDAWGEPDEIKVSGSVEQWIYKKERLWSGMWGFVVLIPVPFILPTDWEQMVVEFSDNQVESAYVDYQHGSGGGCSFIPIPTGHGLLFGCDWSEASKEAELSHFCAYGRKFNQ